MTNASNQMVNSKELWGTAWQTSSLNRRTSRVVLACVIASVRRNWSSSGYAVLRGIEGRFEDGVLVIRGSVSSFYYKQIAQELARRIDGVERIVNELTVSYRTTTRSGHDNQED